MWWCGTEFTSLKDGKSMEGNKENIGCFGWVMRATGLMLVWKVGGCLMPWIALVMLILIVKMCA